MSFNRAEILGRTAGGLKSTIAGFFGIKVGADQAAKTLPKYKPVMRANQGITEIKGINQGEIIGKELTQQNALGNFIDNHSYTMAAADVFKTYATTRGGFGQAVNQVYFGGKGISFGNANWGKMAVSAPATIAAGSAGAGAVEGLFTDDNGNFDIAGIPLI